MWKRIGKYKFSISGSIVVLLLVIVLYSLLQETPDDFFQVPANTLVEFNGSHLEEWRNGQVIWKIQAEKIQVNPKTQNAYVVHPSVFFRAPDGVEMTTAANACKVERAQKRIILQAPLQVSTNRGDTLQTAENITYRMDTQQLSGGKVVVKRRDGVRLQGDQFTADAALKKIMLRGHAQVSKGV